MTEITFMSTFLDRLKIPYSLVTPGTITIQKTHRMLREAFHASASFEEDLQTFFKTEVKPNTILYITDELLCHYIILMLPDSNDFTCFCIGPYIIEEINAPNIIERLQEKPIAQQWLPILRHYFRDITCLSNTDGLVAGVEAFATSLWGADHFTSEHYIHGVPNSLEPFIIPPDPQKRIEMFSNIEIFEKMYSDENELMTAVSQGQWVKARAILTNIPLFTLEQRSEPTRNLKNHTIIMNTLLRKAAEYGGVHPLYIDQLSGIFAQRIENLGRNDNFLDLWNEMVQKYCALVTTHSMKHYSLPIQKVITRINFDLSADLSLKANAQYLNMSPSYLSTLFKEETGQTLTDYVNKKRISQAAYLLSYTQTPISTIAQTCGILDDNYFTKLFKKYMNKTPSQFRQDYLAEQR